MGLVWIHVLHSHGFGWVSYGFMCYIVMDLDGSLLDSCVPQSLIWMGFSLIHVSHSYGFGWVSVTQS